MEVVSVVKDPEGEGVPILITEAGPSYEEELATRRRRYAIMMFSRVPCLVLAAVFYQTPWLAVLLLLLSIPLPWMAVLIANDRLPGTSAKFSRYRGEQSTPEIEARQHPVIDT